MLKPRREPIRALRGGAGSSLVLLNQEEVFELYSETNSKPSSNLQGW